VGFAVIIAIGSVVAGAVAAVAGFGIGSILTPLMALRADTKTAVAAVSVPHLIGTALRFWRLRRHVDRGVFWSFGVTSAVGGLIGALLHNFADSPVLSVIFGALLVFAGISGLTGLSAKMRFGRKAAYVAGAVSEHWEAWWETRAGFARPPCWDSKSRKNRSLPPLQLSR